MKCVMILPSYIWLLLCYAQHTRTDVLGQYEDISSSILNPRTDQMVTLPIELGVDKTSGCICRASEKKDFVVCFGGYSCKRIPKVTTKSRILRIRTSVIESIQVGELDYVYYLKNLQLEANHRLKFIEPGCFRNLSKLEELSISYSPALQAIYENTFEGLIHLKNLTMVKNGFTNIIDLTPALHPRILPSLESLDLSENVFQLISKQAFRPMEGTRLKRLQIYLCQTEYISASAFLPLRKLEDLSIGENDLNTSLIEEFLSRMVEADIHLKYLDLTGMTFRRHPPRKLLEVIAQSSISTLILAKNQFEVILDYSFPTMINIKVLDLRKVSAIYVGPNAFEPKKFPNLKALLLSGNNLPGIHEGHLSYQLEMLDLSCNSAGSVNPTYYEIDRDTFIDSYSLKILNLSFNRIKAIQNYTFRGLNKLKLLNLENGSIYHIGPDTFKSTSNLEILNLANNPLTASSNLTRAQFSGLRHLRVLSFKNCGIKYLNEADNIFVNMPNLTHLILRNNELLFITASLLKPLIRLQVLDLSENFLVSWSTPLFFGTGVKLSKLYLANNKISHFSVNMLEDINYIIESNNDSTEIDLFGNIFVCDCSAMYTTYTWIEVNASYSMKQYFTNSKFLCCSPDLWEDRRVVEYLRSIKSLDCIMYDRISNAMVFLWTTPTIFLLLLVIILVSVVIRYRVYIKYWLFLAKLALGRGFLRKSHEVFNSEQIKEYKYDAFISYSNDDREFVLEMVSRLESDPPHLKLCMYERDFEIGSFISESILNSINESKFIILVISNSFAKSQWCRWETQLAEYHRLFLEDGSVYDPLVLVRLGHIEPKYLTTTLKFLLKTKIYLSWEDHNQEEFWKKLRNVLIKR